MATHIALLRAVNVGGTGKLPMAKLKTMCVKAGFENVQTYIASGNVLLDSERKAATIKTTLEGALEAYAGKPVGVFVLNQSDLVDIRDANPFSQAPGNRVMVTFMDGPVSEQILEGVKNRKNEDIRLGGSVLYTYYPDGMRQSKLIIPAAKTGTSRNMNTVTKLAELAAARHITG